MERPGCKERIMMKPATNFHDMLRIGPKTAQSGERRWEWEGLRSREGVHDDEQRGAVALRHLLHSRPPHLAIDAERVDENLPHHRAPHFLRVRIVHEPVVALRNSELRPAAAQQRQEDAHCHRPAHAAFQSRHRLPCNYLTLVQLERVCGRSAVVGPLEIPELRRHAQHPSIPRSWSSRPRQQGQHEEETETSSSFSRPFSLFFRLRLVLLSSIFRPSLDHILLRLMWTLLQQFHP